ncbi:DUF6207 family protein [Streptomyces sp. NPDC005566]|uniref:DUF6207 family protein n=1 Tax=Streptomyces sp. NPDC005566 TaxID=3156886 RepID=UPI0033ADB8EB
MSQKHLSEPGLVVVEVVADDEQTAVAAVNELGAHWATSGPSLPWRVPDEPGVRVRTYADTRDTRASALVEKS